MKYDNQPDNAEGSVTQLDIFNWTMNMTNMKVSCNPGISATDTVKYMMVVSEGVKHIANILGRNDHVKY